MSCQSSNHSSSAAGLVEALRKIQADTQSGMMGILEEVRHAILVHLCIIFARFAIPGIWMVSYDVPVYDDYVCALGSNLGKYVVDFILRGDKYHIPLADDR